MPASSVDKHPAGSAFAVRLVRPVALVLVACALLALAMLHLHPSALPRLHDTPAKSVGPGHASRLVPVSPPTAILRPEAESEPVSALPPPDLANALNLPPGEARAQAFGTAIGRWILNEPDAAASWIPRLADPVEFDRAAALLVIHTDTLHRPTALALGWAEDIASPELRALALLRVLREWAERDPDAAFRYVEKSPALAPAERAPLLAALTPFPPET